MASTSPHFECSCLLFGLETVPASEHIYQQYWPQPWEQTAWANWCFILWSISSSWCLLDMPLPLLFFFLLHDRLRQTVSFSLTAALENQGGYWPCSSHSVVATHHHSSVAMQNDHSYLVNYLGCLIAVHTAISQTSRFVFHVKQIVACSTSQVSTQETFYTLEFL